MGQAKSDLPDPLDNQTAAAAPGGGGADDLLSQLAGDEIDRLLAEADVESGAAPEVDPAAAGVVAAVAVEEPAAEEPATVAEEAAAAVEADAPVEAVAEAAAVQGKPAASDLDAQLEKLAQELLPQTEQERALTPVDAAVVAEEQAAVAAIVAEAGEERGALLADVPTEAGEAESLLEEESAGAVPWYLRPLLWLNAPFASLSDQARDLIGKVALATLLFSFTVLAFVAMTRHRP